MIWLVTPLLWTLLLWLGSSSKKNFLLKEVVPSFSAFAFTRETTHSQDKHRCCQIPLALSETSGGANTPKWSWTSRSQWPRVNGSVVPAMLVPDTPKSPPKGQKIEWVIKQTYHIRAYRRITLLHLSLVHRLTFSVWMLSSRMSNTIYTQKRIWQLCLPLAERIFFFSYSDHKINKWILKGLEVNVGSEMCQY